jgi:hypothetical protein
LCDGTTKATKADGNGRFGFYRDDDVEPRAMRGVSMTGFETGTRGTAAGAGYWLFDPVVANGETTRSLVKNLVATLVDDENGWANDVVRIPICGSAWLQQYTVHDWGERTIASYIEWIDMAVCEALQQGVEAVIIDNHLWAVARQTEDHKDVGEEDGCTGINHIDDNGSTVDSCAPHDWYGAYASERTGTAYNAGDDIANWQCAIANADGITLANLLRADPTTGVTGLEHFKNLWYDLAIHYKDNQNVFFELWNEPYNRRSAEFGEQSSMPKGPAFGTAYAESEYDWAGWAKVFDETIKVIREDAGADNVIIVSSMDWGYDWLGDGTSQTGGPIVRPAELMPWTTRGTAAIAYGFHPYQHGSCCGAIGASSDLSVSDPFQSAFCMYAEKRADGSRTVSHSTLPLSGSSSSGSTATCDTDGYAETVDKKAPPCVWVAAASRQFMGEHNADGSTGLGLCGGDRTSCAALNRTQCEAMRLGAHWGAPAAGGWSKHVMPMNGYGPLFATEFGSFDCSSPFVANLMTYMRQFGLSYTSWALW